MLKKVILIFVAVVLFGLKMNAQSFSYLEHADGTMTDINMVAKSNGQVIFTSVANAQLAFPDGQSLRLSEVSLGIKVPKDFKVPREFSVREGSLNGKKYIVGLIERRLPGQFHLERRITCVYVICNEGETCPGRQEIIDYVKLKSQN